MDNIKIIEVEGLDGVTQHVIIDRGNGEFTSMPKAIWDELQANQGGLN
jgi:acyl-CoA thioesterase FadM